MHEGISASEREDLLLLKELCPGSQHVLATGGGGPHAVISVGSEDGRQQASVAIAPPPSPLDSTRVPALLQRMEDALHADAMAARR